MEPQTLLDRLDLHRKALSTALTEKEGVLNSLRNRKERKGAEAMEKEIEEIRSRISVIETRHELLKRNVEFFSRLRVTTDGIRQALEREQQAILRLKEFDTLPDEYAVVIKTAEELLNEVNEIIPKLQLGDENRIASYQFRLNETDRALTDVLSSVGRRADELSRLMLICDEQVSCVIGEEVEIEVKTQLPEFLPRVLLSVEGKEVREDRILLTRRGEVISKLSLLPLSMNAKEATVLLKLPGSEKVLAERRVELVVYPVKFKLIPLTPKLSLEQGSATSLRFGVELIAGRGGVKVWARDLPEDVECEPKVVDKTGNYELSLKALTPAKAGDYTFSLVAQTEGQAPSTESCVLSISQRTVEEVKEVLPGYKLVERLGKGGFAVVYKAVRARDNRWVALKIPESEMIDFSGKSVPTVDMSKLDKLLKDLANEAIFWGGLKHPNIVQMYEFGTKPWPFLAMEYMEGGNLRDKLGSGPLSLREALQISINISDALEYAHHFGGVHRDIKPENILFDSKGEPNLSDFGLVKVLSRVSSREDRTFGGTLFYASPEQIRGERVDWRSDIYSLGCTIYEMLVGKPPFIAEDTAGLIYMHLEAAPKPPSLMRSEVPKELDEIVLRSMQKDPEKRYPYAIDLKNDLASVYKKYFSS